MAHTQGKRAINKNYIWGKLDIRDTKKKKKRTAQLAILNMFNEPKEIMSEEL